jgi:hypothetical protein
VDIDHVRITMDTHSCSVWCAAAQAGGKARNLRTSNGMKRVITSLAVAALALGGRHFYRYLNSKKKKRLHQVKLEVWEGEGGAVPVTPHRTTAQIAPLPPASPSLRTDN